jgi:hypothetical protein
LGKRWPALSEPQAKDIGPIWKDSANEGMS